MPPIGARPVSGPDAATSTPTTTNSDGTISPTGPNTWRAAPITSPRITATSLIASLAGSATAGGHTSRLGGLARLHGFLQHGRHRGLRPGDRHRPGAPAGGAVSAAQRPPL